jgi:hypothetical protein
MMNRQLRRAQKKQDEKADKDRRRKRADRRSRIANLRAERSRRRSDVAKRREEGKSGGDASPARSGGGRMRNPGRFSGVLLIATIFFISLNAAVSRPDVEAGASFLNSPEAFSVIGALYYALFGYFAVMWLNRRQLGRPVALALFAGVMLALGGEAAKLIQGEYTPDLLFLALLAPALLLGTLGGRWVHDNSV